MNFHPMRVLYFLSFVFLIACGGSAENEKEELEVFPAELSEFVLVDQDSNIITNETFKGKIYITDFFFTSCPSICPIMSAQMLRVYEEFEDHKDDILFLSHSIDPKRDSVDVLKAYEQKLGVSSDRWHFVTGGKEMIYGLAEQYMVTAFPDESIPGGYEHSGYFILVDREGQVRGYYDGTLEEEVDELMVDLQILLDAE